MANTPKAPSAAFDEDEDLFHFDELYAEKPDSSGDEVDLEEFLRAFAEPSSQTAATASAPAQAEIDAPVPSISTAPDAQSSPTARAQGPVGLALSRSAWIILVCLLAGQVLASTLVWFGGQRARGEVERRSEAIEATAEELRQDLERRFAAVEELTRPVVSPEVTVTAETFARIDRLLATREFARARRETYALLALVDRLEEPARTDTEARARLLLADGLRLEADSRESSP